MGAAFGAFRDKVRADGPQLRHGLRVTVAGLAAFAIARSLNFPMHGLWAVLTAIVVSQVSVGGSLRATIEYAIGTLGGAVYAASIGLAVPHSTPLAQAVVLALSVAPLAFAAAISPSLRAAPFSAVLVLFIGAELGESPAAAALTRVLEVAIGAAAAAVVVSLVVFPERARTGVGRGEPDSRPDGGASPRLARKAHARRRQGEDRAHPEQSQRRGHGVRGLAEEARRERIVSAARDPDPTPLACTLLPIRHDFVMLSRATVEPFPGAIAQRLDPLVTRFGAEATAFLCGCAAVLSGRESPPSIAPTQAALGACGAEISPGYFTPDGG